MRLWLAVWLLLPLAGALAEDNSASREHFRKGAELYQAGRFQEAVVEFEAANRPEARPELEFNIGRCYDRIGDRERAILAYRRYVEQLPFAADAMQVRARIGELEAQRARPRTTALETARHPWPPARRLKIAGLTIAGLGVAAVLLGTGFAVEAQSANHTLATRQPFDPATEDRRDLYQALDISWFSIGGGLVAGGLSLFLAGQLHPQVVDREVAAK